ncbi:hypothetical protein [Streptomyces narbonensis]|uniref:hypothetical protein n=1 Tax=Streptomyces narbonensis TaxID=67333 RepID=UPI0033FAE56E
MNVTLNLTGSAAEFIAGTGMVEHPGTPDEVLFRRYWAGRSVRRYGRGSRHTLTAPVWVMNWIADAIEFLAGSGEGVEASAAERKGARDFMDQVFAAGIRNRCDGPSRDDLVEAGLMDAEPVEAAAPAPVNAEAQALREKAAEEDRKAYESFERCDTDGALSQWAWGVTAQKDRLEADILEAGGKAEFGALFDLDGNLVPAKEIETQFGWSWMLLDERGKCAGWFNASKARNEDTARKNNAKKGFYVGRVRVPAYAKLAGGNICTVMAIKVRKDGGYSADAEVIDNGL